MMSALMVTPRWLAWPVRSDGEVVVLVLFEGVVAEVAPENGGHAEIVSLREALADFDDLAIGAFGAEINRGADGGCAHVVGFLDGAEENFVGFDWG